MRCTTILPLIGGTLCLVVAAVAQESPQPELDRGQFQNELSRLAGICGDLELAREAEICRRWLPSPRQDRTLLFQPKPAWDEQQDSVALSSWAKHFNAARQKYANYLFQRAQQQVADNEQTAYIQLWQVLREHPEHRAARQVLGALAKGATVRPRLTRGRTAHPELGWPAGSYRRIDTPHFRLTTRADNQASLQLARKLEVFYTLWTQVFYPLWAPPGLLQDKLAGKSTSWPKHRGMEVFLLKDRNDYLQVLGIAEDNIGASVGYYNPSAKKSFFYPAEELEATLYHELTHQLLMEATHIDAKADAGTRGGVWILEGIALYMESLADRGSYWTVGGWEAPRLQTARYRGVRDGYWPAWSTFAQGTTEDWKADPDIARLYSHAAGLTHVLLDGLGEESRRRYLQTLVGVYQGQDDSQELLASLAGSEEQAKVRYQERLRIDDGDVRALNADGTQPRDLVLCGSELTQESWRSLGQLTQLEWLDLSFSNVAEEDLDWLPAAQSLTRLSLEGTTFSGQRMSEVASLPGLVELDLSGCPIDDAAIAALRGHRTLQVLWLHQTPLTDASLPVLATISKLERCDITGSRITPSAWQKFLQEHPHLRR